jgi:hypothetical protein
VPRDTISAVNWLPTFRRYPLLLEFLVVGFAAALGHHFASQFGLYYAVGYTDIVMHLVGGVWAGLATLLVFFTSGFVRLPWRNRRVVLVVTVASVLAIGLAWEVHELTLGLVDLAVDGADTLADVLLDLTGGLLAVIYFWLAVRPHDNARA